MGNKSKKLLDSGSLHVQVLPMLMGPGGDDTQQYLQWYKFPTHGLLPVLKQVKADKNS